MPFQAHTGPLPPAPQIRVYFHGLIVLSSDDGMTVAADIHRTPSREHTLSVEVRAKRPDQPDMVLLRHHGPLRARHPGLRINMNSPASAAFKHIPFNVDPFSAEPLEASRRDFGWIVNLQSGRYHGPGLSVRPAVARPGAVIEGGHCYVYSAARIVGGFVGDIKVLQGVNDPDPDPEPRVLNGLAHIVAADLHFSDADPGRAAEITCNGVGSLVLPRLLGQAFYEVYINNSPLFDPPDGPGHDELREYYRIVERRANPGNDIHPREQFRIDVPPGGGPFRGTAKFNSLTASARIPCMPVVLD